MRIKSLDAWEILDSRGHPTVAARLVLNGGSAGTVSIPSGASTGKAEAKELRDGGKRFGGNGCTRAVANIRGPIAKALEQENFDGQQQLDHRLLELDETHDKSRLGANAVLAVSLAFARAAAKERGLELFDYFATLLPQSSPGLPNLIINLFSGGKHAFGQVAVQDVSVVPTFGSSIGEWLAQTYDVYQEAAAISLERYNSRALTADEGGLAPPFRDTPEMLESAAESIQRAGYKLGKEIAIAIDVAASHFAMADDRYYIDKQILSARELVDIICGWIEKYPIVSVEDGLGEEDWTHWPLLRQRLGSQCLTLADDLTCTNPSRIRRAIQTDSANALLLKVNQIGTITEAKEAYLLAKSAGWRVSVSARSGETEDNWLADLAVGWSSDFIKVGSITQSERLAKYNRLLEIERVRFPVTNNFLKAKRCC